MSKLQVALSCALCSSRLDLVEVMASIVEKLGQVIAIECFSFYKKKAN